MQRRSWVSLLAAALAFPCLARAAADSPLTYLARVQPPPSSLSAALARFAMGKDTANLPVEDGLKAWSKQASQRDQDKGQAIADKMKNMTQDEKIAYAQQLVQQQQAQMSADPSAALENSQAILKTSADLSAALTKAQSALNAVEKGADDRSASINAKARTALKACPQTTGGEDTGPVPGCSGPLNARRSQDLRQAAADLLSKSQPILKQLKADLTAVFQARQDVLMKDLDSSLDSVHQSAIGELGQEVGAVSQCMGFDNQVLGKAQDLETQAQRPL